MPPARDDVWQPLRTAAIAAVLVLGLLPSAARADRHYFPLTYLPYLDPPGENELEFWTTSRSGKQDPAEGATFESRLEWEHAFASRFTAAAYLNFLRPPGGPLKLQSPSLEFIYQPVGMGRFAVDPALYLEVTESGHELELEPKLLFARRMSRWLAAMNLIGDFEFRHDDQERLASGAILHNLFAGEIDVGLARDLGRRVAVGIEARGRSEHPNFGRKSASLFSLGPTVNFSFGAAQLTLGWLPQIRGAPRTSGSRNLDDFERTQVRALLGIEL